MNNRKTETHPPILAASLLAADSAKFGEEATQMIEAGADWIHFDVMDNHFVPNLTFGPDVCQALRRFGVKAPIDVHLMVKPVDALIVQFAKAGATLITFHPEASLHVDKSLQIIKDHGCQAGLAFNPATPLSCFPYVKDKLDLILLMSVNPGFGGQKFIASTLEKISEARALIDESGLHIRLAVDGGIDLSNVKTVAKRGADTFVIGSALFNHKHHSGVAQDLKDHDLKNHDLKIQDLNQYSGIVKAFRSELN